MELFLLEKIYGKNMLYLIVGSCVFLGSIVQCDSNADKYLKKVFFSSDLNEKLGQFIDNVLRQPHKKAILDVTDDSYELLTSSMAYSLYEYLIKFHYKASIIDPYYQLKALAYQKDVLSSQALELLNRDKKINGCVEIGAPATYISKLKKNISFEGKTYAVLDQESKIHVAQASSYSPAKKFKAYDQYVPLNNYEPISEKDIPSNSVDLVVCFIGLHHIPVDKIDAYIASIHRILRPGGTFLLRDHDVKDKDMHALVDAVHSVFNIIVDRVSYKDNQEEIRNFQSMDYWISKVQPYGFSIGKDRLLQKGDPSSNTMMAFEKLMPINKDEYIDHVTQSLKDEKRPLINTFLTTPEWFNVDSSQDYGSFINHTPFYEFPYFAYIKAYWMLFVQSWKSAAKRQGNMKVLMSDYTFMNMFIGAMMTAEYTAKGIVSLPVAWMNSGVEPSAITMLVEDKKNEVLALDKDIKILETYDHNIFKIQAPRYKQFLSMIHSLAQTDVHVIEIAGQREMQCKVRYKASGSDPVWHYGTCEYSWKLPTSNEYTYAAISVPVENITSFITMLNNENIDLLYCHDF